MPRTDFQINKRIAVVAGFALSILIAPFYIYFGDDTNQYLVLRVTEALIFSVLILIWCHYDAAERGEEISGVFRFLLIIFGVLALVFYFLRTRGVKRGLIAGGAAILLFMAMILTTALIQSALAMIFSYFL